MTNVEKINAFLDKAGVWFFLTTNGAAAILAENPAISTFINADAGSKFQLFHLEDGHAVLGSMKGHTEEFDV